MTADVGHLQQAHWQSTYEAHPHMYGDEASDPACRAAERFTADGDSSILELGSGTAGTASTSPIAASTCTPLTSAPRA